MDIDFTTYMYYIYNHMGTIKNWEALNFLAQILWYRFQNCTLRNSISNSDGENLEFIRSDSEKNTTLENNIGLYKINHQV